MTVYNSFVNVVSNPSYTIQNGIDDVIASGLTSSDVGVVTISSGVYSEDITINEPSGRIILYGNDSEVDSITITNSGIVTSYYNAYTDVDVTGSGNIEFFDGSITSGLVTNTPNITFINLQIYSGITFTDCNYFEGTNLIVSGEPSSLTFNNAQSVNLVYGLYASGDAKLQFIGCSSVYMDHLYGYRFTGSAPLFISGCPDMTLHYCSFANTSGTVLYAPASSGNIEYTIIAASGGAPVTSDGYTAANAIDATGSCLVNYSAIGTAYTYVSGHYITVDPLFTDVDGGDVRLRATSPCGSAAEYIDEVSFSGNQQVYTTVSPSSVHFFEHDQDWKAPRPTGFYIVQDGQALFMEGYGGLTDSMDVVIYNQYSIQATGILVEQSLVDAEGKESKYTKDYKIVERMNYESNQPEYYAEPYSIISLDNLVKSTVDELVEAEVSGIIQNVSMSMDHVIINDGEPHYWVLESSNENINLYSSLDHTKLATYPLFRKPVSGSATVLLRDMDQIGSWQQTSRYTTNKFYKDGIGPIEKTITISDSEPRFKWINYLIDQTITPQAILSYKDWIYVITKNTHVTNNDTESYASFYTYNKFDRYPFENPVSTFNISGNLVNYTPTDLTVDDLGHIYISTVSGAIVKYQQMYDYALMTRNPGTMSTTLTFRENYQGVEL